MGRQTRGPVVFNFDDIEKLVAENKDRFLKLNSYKSVHAEDIAADLELTDYEWLQGEQKYYRQNNGAAVKKVEERLGWNVSNRSVKRGFFGEDNGQSRLLRLLAKNNTLPRFEELMKERGFVRGIDFSFDVVDGVLSLYEQFPAMEKFKHKQQFIAPYINSNGFVRDTWSLYHKK